MIHGAVIFVAADFYRRPPTTDRSRIKRIFAESKRTARHELMSTEKARPAITAGNAINLRRTLMLNNANANFRERVNGVEG